MSWCKNNSKILKLLIEKGININCYDNQGCNALSWCSKSFQSISLLVENGININ